VSRHVHALATDAGAFVLKQFPREAWRVELAGSAFNEPALWAGGLTRALPAPLTCPTIDVAYHRERDECWMLMDDVAAGIPPRGSFEDDQVRRVLDGMARLHARHWGAIAAPLEQPLLTIDQRVAMFTEPCAAIGGRIAATGWVADVLDRVSLFRTYVPALLEVLGPRDSDFYLALCTHRERWLAPLTRMVPTLCHGDLRRANIAMLPAGGVSLFDWDFACRAPGAIDIAWYWFLQVWCYPPRDGRTPEDREPLLACYADGLDAALDGRLDRAELRRAWALAWLAAFAQVGFCLADAMVDDPSADEVARVRATCARAVATARRIADDHAA
jgi:hypothetical protein